MSIRHPKDVKFLYFAGLVVLLGFFDFFILKFELGKMPFGTMIKTMVLVNGVGFGFLGITLFIITFRRVRRARMQMWQNTIRDAIKESRE